MMKEREHIPACPHCKSNRYVVRDRTMEKAGTAVGGVIGAGAAYAGCKAGTTSGAALGALAGSLVPVVGTTVGAGIGAVAG
jgi:phage tail tape-measure protein